MICIHIYIRRTYVRMDASNNNMYAWGAAVSITTCRERALDATDPWKKREIDMCVKSGGLTDGGRRKRRRFSRSNGRCSENRTDPVGPTTKCQSLSTC